MASTLEISCAGCGALYRILTKSADVTTLFQCVHCHEYNLFHAGRTLLLNPQTMRDGTEDERRKHVQRRMEDAALEVLADVRRRITTLININVDVEFAPRLDPAGLDPVSPAEETDDALFPDRAMEQQAAMDELLDSFTGASDSGPITDEDLRTFRECLDAPDFWKRLNQS